MNDAASLKFIGKVNSLRSDFYLSCANGVLPLGRRFENSVKHQTLLVYELTSWGYRWDFPPHVSILKLQMTVTLYVPRRSVGA